MDQYRLEHQSNFGDETLPTLGGFPDTGNGRYSDKMSYEKWYRFNLAMRTHQNMVESAPLTISFLLVGGFFYPKYALLAGVINVISKPLYTYSYLTKGPDGRRFSAVLGNLSCYSLGATTLGTIIYNIVKYRF